MRFEVIFIEGHRAPTHLGREFMLEFRWRQLMHMLKPGEPYPWFVDDDHVLICCPLGTNDIPDVMEKSVALLRAFFLLTTCQSDEVMVRYDEPYYVPLIKKYLGCIPQMIMLPYDNMSSRSES